MLLVALLLPGGAIAGKEWCLSCHRPHYQKQNSCTGCHRGNPRTTRQNIAHHGLIRARFAPSALGDTHPAVVKGSKLLEQFACRRCHQSGGKGNRLAVSLDTLPSQRTPEEIAEAIRLPAYGMPDFHLQQADRDRLVIAILVGSSTANRTAPPVQPPLVVHFNKPLGARQAKDPFSRLCGGCHRLLHETGGVMGTGTVGPNLSGLLTEWYPKTADGKPWERDGLKKWLENPRRLRPHTLMRPVAVKPDEFEELMRILSPSTTPGGQP